MLFWYCLCSVWCYFYHLFDISFFHDCYLAKIKNITSNPVYIIIEKFFVSASKNKFLHLVWLLISNCLFFLICLAKWRHWDLDWTLQHWRIVEISCVEVFPLKVPWVEILLRKIFPQFFSVEVFNRDLNDAILLNKWEKINNYLSKVILNAKTYF